MENTLLLKMADHFSPSFSFNNLQTSYSPLEGYEREDAVTKTEQVREDHGGIASFCSGYGISMFHNQQQTISDGGTQIDQQKGMPLSVQSVYGALRLLKNPNLKLGEPAKENPYPSSIASQELLHNQGSMSNESKANARTLSTEQILRVAGERYIQFSTRKANGFASSIHPYGALVSLSVEETRDVELARHLLAAAEKVESKQFDYASSWLTYCEMMASNSGNPVERMVFYFAQALRKRIDKETGRDTTTDYKEEYTNGLSPGANLAYLACHKELPFTQVMQFAGMQAIIDNVLRATKVHLIDLQIRSGILWTPLLQALADRKDDYPIELLKITAIGTKDKEKIEETGKRLRGFAESLKLPFSFNIVFVPDIKDLKEELFNIEANEAVVVYSPIVLRTMISRPDCLESLMTVIRGLKPSVMVVMEVEANHNSPSFVNRFIEALFFYSAFFDSLEDCMDRGNRYRMEFEGGHIRNGIQNMVATEGEERISRSVKLNKWRAFFARFGMVEFELSKSSLFQADLILKQFSRGSSCTLEDNGKCLIVGWKGTPVHSLSVWKFM